MTHKVFGCNAVPISATVATVFFTDAREMEAYHAPAQAASRSCILTRRGSQTLCCTISVAFLTSLFPGSWVLRTKEGVPHPPAFHCATPFACTASLFILLSLEPYHNSFRVCVCAKYPTPKWKSEVFLLLFSSEICPERFKHLPFVKLYYRLCQGNEKAMFV